MKLIFELGKCKKGGIDIAVAKCGQRRSWDSPMWCSGKKINEGKENEKVDKMCYGCAWWKGNSKDYD